MPGNVTDAKGLMENLESAECSQPETQVAAAKEVATVNLKNILLN
jgi:hypothetical protein